MLSLSLPPSVCVCCVCVCCVCVCVCVCGHIQVVSLERSCRYTFKTTDQSHSCWNLHSFPHQKRYSHSIIIPDIYNLPQAILLEL